MSAWRRVALETLPEYSSLIDDAESPMALWVELQTKFMFLSEGGNPDENLIGRVFKYARWCFRSGRTERFLSDAGTAAVCAFYEHLPTNQAIRNDLHRWLSREEFNELSGAFRYRLFEGQFSDFESRFLSGINRIMAHEQVPKHSRKPR